MLRVLDMGAHAPSESANARHLRSTSSPPPPSAPVDPSGSGDDFDAFYRSNYPTVTRLAYSLCGSMTVAEELAQESFVAAHRRWRRIAAFDRPDLWVRRVVINRSISYRRKVASERRALLKFSKRRDDNAEVEVADDEVWSALRGLSRRQAEVLALVYVEDRPISEVAAILRLGEETVRTHLKRGRAALAEKLQPREEAV
ncbi:MAG: RNA polymerase sigma factor [Ilumatobacter sp.]